MSQEFNEMEHLERQIIKRYNELLKTLLEEGDMDTLERVITDDGKAVIPSHYLFNVKLF